jgi:hypothetical protein
LRDYRALIAKGRKLFSPCYLIYAMPYGKTVIKAAVKKRIGNAVARNLENGTSARPLERPRLEKPALGSSTRPRRFLPRKGPLVPAFAPGSPD